MNLTDTFVHTLYTLKSQPIPAEVKEETRKCLLDQVGVMLAGARQLSNHLGNYLDMFSGDDATAVGLGRRASLQNAALVRLFTIGRLFSHREPPFCIMPYLRAQLFVKLWFSE